jgi:hypothetical protein
MGRQMSYQVLYGDGVALAGRDLQADETNMYSEQFGTENEALHRARELLDGDAGTIVAVRNPASNLLSGVRLQLRLGYLCT